MNKKEKELYRKTYGDKVLKEFNKSQRVVNGFNTGTITMKSNKDYLRKEKHKKDYQDIED